MFVIVVLWVSRVYGYCTLSVVQWNARENSIIGASRSEPHTNQYYEKITVLMYIVCMRVAIRRPRVHHTCACVICS